MIEKEPTVEARRRHDGGSMAESAVARHDRMVREEMLQAERVRSTADVPPDFWQSLARNFRAPADPAADPTPDALAALIGPEDDVIDVGSGGGRIAIPLSRRCRELTAVEPSPAMRAVLEDEIAKHQIRNIRIVPARWEDAAVEPAALAFAAHVTYGIQVIEPFLRKLDAAARRRAALVTVTDPPQTPFAPFWRWVHGEERLRLPCRDELLAVLRERGVEPVVVPIGPAPLVSFGTPSEALDLLRFRLVVGPGTPADDRLHRALEALAEERDGRLWPRAAPPNQRSVIHWAPGHFR
jgi:SAM-dependent methyltransferase